jgi:hypothetical protein
MANSWSIVITQLPNGTVGFRPDLPGATIGQPLGAANGDIVNWNNETNNTLTLVSIPPGTFLTDPIPAGQASDPGFQVGGSITYSCVSPSQQQHSIVVPPANVVA